jgi:hypothetical protein
LPSGQIIVASGDGAGKLNRIVGAQRMHAAESGGARDDRAIHRNDNIPPLDLLFETGDESISVRGIQTRGRLAHHTAKTRYDLDFSQFRDDNRMAYARPT